MGRHVMTRLRLLLYYIPWNNCYNPTRYQRCPDLVSLIGSPLRERMFMKVYETGYSPQSSCSIMTSLLFGRLKITLSHLI